MVLNIGTDPPGSARVGQLGRLDLSGSGETRVPLIVTSPSCAILVCDKALLTAAIEQSLEHLRPWMPWAENEPEELERKIRRLRKYRADFDLDRDFVYGIWNADANRVLEGTGLHTRVGEGAREIGYWIHAHTRDAVTPPKPWRL